MPGIGNLLVGRLKVNFQKMENNILTENSNPRITSGNKYSRIQDHRDKNILCRKDMVAHFWDLNEHY